MQVLQTPRLTLRWFHAGDARHILALLNDPGWLRHIGDRHVHSKRDARQWIVGRLVPAYGRLGFGFWAAEQRSDGAFVGMCGLIQRDTLPEVDVGYALLPRFRKRGLAREAAAACLQYGREVLGLSQIWGITSPGNRASARVLESIGLRDAGVRAMPGERRPTRVFIWQADGPATDDRAAIDALVQRVLSALDHRGDGPSTLPALPHYFLPSASISVARADGSAAIGDLHGFIGPRAALRMSGRLHTHEEREIAQRTELAGPMAQRWSRIERRGQLDGDAYVAQGTWLLLLVRTTHGWKIAALAASDDAHPAPDAPG